MQQQNNDNLNVQVQAFQSGDITGFNYFFDLYYAAICYFAFSLLKDQAVAEEIADDAFIKLWERRYLYNTPEAIKAFLYRTIRNASLNYLRNSKTLAAFSDNFYYLAEKDEPSIEHHIIRAETLQQVYNSLDILPEKCRKVFTLFYLENKSYEEIALELELSVNNVRNHKMRALNLLRGQLGPSLIMIGLIAMGYNF
ncbi:MAG: polymerase sigma-70 factor [Segetibacter sp.]|nr:polymerase sigma-70 factor [Segetibacter sp.]